MYSVGQKRKRVVSLTAPHLAFSRQRNLCLKNNRTVVSRCQHIAAEQQPDGAVMGTQPVKT